MTPNIWLNHVCYETWLRGVLNFKPGLAFTNTNMRFSLKARDCQTHVWTLHYLHCVEEMNNKHHVLWISTKENNKFASILLPRKDGFLQATVQIKTVADRQGGRP